MGRYIGDKNMSTVPKCKLTGLYPAQSMDQMRALPDPHTSYGVFELDNVSEAGVHASLRIVPALVIALGQTNITIPEALLVSQAAAIIAKLVAGQGVQLSDLMQVLEDLGIKL